MGNARVEDNVHDTPADEARAAFDSILLPGDAALTDASTVPDCFTDLALDQIVAAVTAGYEEYRLEVYFHRAPCDPKTLRFRQQVMRDLEATEVMAAITDFCDAMRETRTRLTATGQMRDAHQQQAVFLSAVRGYCQALRLLAQRLTASRPRSPGLCRFLDYLRDAIGSPAFVDLHQAAENLGRELSAIRYAVTIKDRDVTVSRYRDEAETAARVRIAFANFMPETLQPHEFRLIQDDQLNPVEAEILAGVSSIYPEVFQSLADFHAAHADFVDPMIRRFDREINFYRAWLGHLERFKSHGLSFCYPQISTTDKHIVSRDSFDLALAARLIEAGQDIVCNDFELRHQERLLIVTGPNQGGKTTFARTVGQLHWLAALGCPVPGSEARLLLFDQLYTHFEKEEALDTLRGKLHDDLVRIHDILEAITPRSLVILNEIFNSTALEDAILSLFQ